MGRAIGATIFCVSILVTSSCGKKFLPQAGGPSAIPLASVDIAPPPAQPPQAAAAVPGDTESEEGAFARKTLDQLNDERPLGDVFFDLDQATLRESDRAVLQRNAEWLQRWRTVHIALEGHADERGTAEYNLGRGHRRAVVVRDYLASLGLHVERVSTLSKGKEQPLCRDSAESCWQQNRRGHFTIVAK